VSRLLFITHPEVVIDPAVPVPEWPLSQRGRDRMAAFAQLLDGQTVAAVWSSAEQKARDGAEILSARTGLAPRVDAGLGENDRSATGYIAPPEFWEVVEQFFGRPDESVRGWETARAAQARVVGAIDRVLQASDGEGLVLVVAHGGVGRLLMAHLQGVEIGEESRPPLESGGCWLAIDRDTRRLAQDWRTLEDGLD
jgi:broad specificity phosphatase PhoE